MCVLVAVWVSVYWFYDRGEPPVTFDDHSLSPSDVTIRPEAMAELSPGPAPVVPVRPVRTEAAPTKRPAATPSTPPSGMRVIPPTFTEYVVQPRDTFQTIARKLLGDSKYSRSIAEANKFVDPLRLMPGRTVLRIPVDPNNVEGRVVRDDQAPAAPVVKSEPAATPAARAIDAGFTEYVITREDTLSSIAQAFYGKSSLWRTIYEANTDVIPDPDQLKLGTTIRIPKR